MKAALFSLLLCGSSSVHAFTLNSSTSSNFRGWSDAHIHFKLNLTNCPAGVDVRGIISDALAVWNNVATSRVKLSVDGDTTVSTESNPIPIVCDTNYGSSDPGIANGSPGAAVVLPQTGDYITSGIMMLNASSGNANIANFDRSIVAVTLAHEIGHLLGLGHSQDVSALMYYDASLKNRLSLAQDDIDGITYLYPRDELSKDGLAGCGRVSNSASKPGGGAMALFLLLLPLAVLLKMRTSKSGESVRKA